MRNIRFQINGQRNNILDSTGVRLILRPIWSVLSDIKRWQASLSSLTEKVTPGCRPENQRVAQSSLSLRVSAWFSFSRHERTPPRFHPFFQRHFILQKTQNCRPLTSTVHWQAIEAIGFSMLSHLLKIWLIVSILGYGMALAADVHGKQTVDGAHLSAVSPDNPADSGGDSGCNHCAHGISHLLGLNCNNSMPTLNSVSSLLSSVQHAWHSFYPPSLLRPPIFI